MKTHKLAIAAIVALVLVAPISAGTYLESNTTMQSDQGDLPGGMGDMKLRGWAEGQNAKIEILSSGNPIFPSGSYLLTNDGGKSFFVVNEQAGTYSKFDLAGMLGMAGSMMEGLGGIMKMEFTDVHATTKLEEAGPRMLGHPTKHVQIESGYTTKVKMMGFKQESKTASTQDIWYVSGLEVEGMSYWLGKDPPVTGNEQFDQMIAMESNKVDGLPLKTVIVAKSDDGKGGTTTTTTTSEVTALREENIANSTFVLDPSLQETELVLPEGLGMPEGGNEEEGGLGSLFGRKKKKKGN